MWKRCGVFDRTDLLFLFLFFISWSGRWTLLIFYVCLLVFLAKGAEGCIKGLLFLTARGLMNPAAAVPAGGFELLKWLLLLLFSFRILLFTKVKGKARAGLRRILGALMAFSIPAAGFSLLVSSYPIVAVFKAAVFSITMSAVFTGVSHTEEPGYWLDYFSCFYSVLFAVSVILIPFDRFRTVNNDFQGVFNHVNVLGGISALYVSGMLYSRYFSGRIFLRNLLVFAVVLMAFLSRSRSGVFTILGVLGLRYLMSSRPARVKLFVCLCGMTLVLVFRLLMPESWALFSDTADAFIYKGNDSSIWAHRLSQIRSAGYKFASNPWTGSGFMVPYDPGYRSFRFTFSLVVEPGNLIWAVLGDTGLSGAAGFLLLLFQMIRAGGRRNLGLAAGAVLVNMGEMVFFSPNNYGVLIYLLLAVYAFDRKGQEETADETELYRSGMERRALSCAMCGKHCPAGHDRL